MSCNCNGDGWYEVTEDSTFFLLASVRLPATNALATVDDVEAFEVDTFDITDEDNVTQLTDGDLLDPVDEYVSYFYDAPQTDSRWTKNSEGYNFAYPVVLVDADLSILVSALVFFKDGTQTKLKWKIRTK
jgi:hypothetical protein